MKKTHKNYQVGYSSAIKALKFNDEEFEAVRDVRSELERQLERERKSAAEFPEAYRLIDIMSSSCGNTYRSGDCGGARVMTHEDYLRMIVAETDIPEYGKRQRKSYDVAPRPATAYKLRGYGRSLSEEERGIAVRESVIGAEGVNVARIERSDTTAVGSILRFIEKWFPAHTLIKPDRRHRRRLASSAAGVAWVMIFALVIALPITIGVLKSDAGSELAAKREELAALTKTEAELQAEFESSLDLREIESIATGELGMISLNQSTIRILRLNDIDTIESFSDSGAESVVPALLTALGIRIGDE